MAKLVAEKQCERCSKIIYSVDIATKYCEECREEVKKEFYAENFDRRKAKRNKDKNTEEKLTINFLKVVKNDFHLTTTGFNEISNIKSESYRNYYRMTWFEIMEIYGKSENLENYVLNEYKKFVNTGYQDFKKFVKDHKYISEAIVRSIGKDKLRMLANVKIRRNTNDDYRTNFFDIVEKLGRIPLFHEFAKLSHIKITSYANHLNLKGKQYENIIKHYVSEDEFAEYLKLRLVHKGNVGAETGKLSQKYSDDDLEKEFHRVYDFCLNTYGHVPPRKLFNGLSTIDESVYRNRFNMGYLDVCEMYGYEVDKTNNRSEKTALETVKSIINEEYIAQKRFEWLRGIHNFPLFCDGYFPEHKLVIEFDGRQHRQPIEKYGGEEMFKTIQANDNIKNEQIPQHGLKIIRIFCEEPFWNKEYIKNKLIKYNII